MMDGHVINFERAKELETELGLMSLLKTKQTSLKQPKVVMYCPFNHTYTQILDYETKDIISLLNSFQKNNFLIIQIDNDHLLYEEILKLQFKSEFENIYKLFDLKLDYCFSPIDGLLCFNLSVLTNIECDEIEKFFIQIFFTEYGVYIINKDDCNNIESIFKKKFSFIELSKGDFLERALVLNKEKYLTSGMNINASENQRKSKVDEESNIHKTTTKRRDSITNFNMLLKKPSFKGGPNLNLLIESDVGGLNTNPKFNFKQDATINLNENLLSTSNFSTDDLIYYLLVMSLDKLEEFADSLVKEAESLKGIYLELSEKERKDFFRRIHNMEISLQLIYGETVIKKKFLKYSKAQFRVYNRLSQNFFFKKTFNFFIELMISKVTQLEITFEKLENTIRMIKENYSIIIEDNTEKQNIKLNSVMKVLAILSTLYVPLNLLPNIFGMNIKLPFQEYDNYWPFFGILGTAIALVVILLFIFKKLKWLED